jgi:hypothetical protein
MTWQARIERRIGIRYDWQRYTLSAVAIGIMVWAIWSTP